MPASVGFKRPRDASAPPSPSLPQRPQEEEAEEEQDSDGDGSASSSSCESSVHWGSALEEPPLTPDEAAPRHSPL
jgi:hypothetical protein